MISPMDLKVLYWTFAWLNLLILSAFALVGIFRIRKGQVAKHRVLMLTAVWLIVGFVVSYAIKLALLGREDLSKWSTPEIWLLRFHEACIAVMLLFGGFALVHGRRFQRTRLLSTDEDAPAPNPTHLTRHRFAGRVAVISMFLALITAGGVLLGMYERIR
ncbi:MAG: hypothetical protein CL917_17380 [Deltaproteobacteria bacterium]|nr:hypothetical protein [Deltaproteobacteria bacterium]